MRLMMRFWQWIVPGGVGAVIGSVATGTFLWFYPSRKEWRAERQAKTEKSNDAKIIQVLGAGGNFAAGQLVETCRLKQNEVDESLDRLEAKGRIKRIGPTSTTVTSWFLLPR